MANGEQEQPGFLKFLLGSALAGFGGDASFGSRWMENQRQDEERRRQEELQKKLRDESRLSELAPLLPFLDQAGELEKFAQRPNMVQTDSDVVPQIAEVQRLEPGTADLAQSLTAGFEGMDAPDILRQGLAKGNLIQQARQGGVRQDFMTNLGLQGEFAEELGSIRGREKVGEFEATSEIRELERQEDMQEFLEKERIRHGLRLREIAASKAGDDGFTPTQLRNVAKDSVEGTLRTFALTMRSRLEAAAAGHGPMVTISSPEAWQIKLTQLSKDLPGADALTKGEIDNIITGIVRAWHPDHDELRQPGATTLALPRTEAVARARASADDVSNLTDEELRRIERGQ